MCKAGHNLELSSMEQKANFGTRKLLKWNTKSISRNIRDAATSELEQACKGGKRLREYDRQRTSHVSGHVTRPVKSCDVTIKCTEWKCARYYGHAGHVTEQKLFLEI